MATEDHNTPTIDIDKPIADPVSKLQVDTLRANAEEFGVRIHSLGDIDQGVVQKVNVEEAGQFGVSSAATMLEQLG